MDIRENYLKNANDYFGETYEEEVSNVELDKHMEDMLMQHSAYDIVASLLKALENKEPEIAKQIQSALGPLPED